MLFTLVVKYKCFNYLNIGWSLALLSMSIQLGRITEINLSRAPYSRLNMRSTRRNYSNDEAFTYPSRGSQPAKHLQRGIWQKMASIKWSKGRRHQSNLRQLKTLELCYKVLDNSSWQFWVNVVKDLEAGQIERVKLDYSPPRNLGEW